VALLRRLDVKCHLEIHPAVALARTPEQARALAERVAHALAPRLAGDPAGIQAVAETKPGAPEDGAVRIELTQ